MALGCQAGKGEHMIDLLFSPDLDASFTTMLMAQREELQPALSLHVYSQAPSKQANTHFDEEAMCVIEVLPQCRATHTPGADWSHAHKHTRTHTSICDWPAPDGQQPWLCPQLLSALANKAQSG